MKSYILIIIITLSFFYSCRESASNYDQGISLVNNEAVVDSLYSEAMTFYDAKNYAEASKKFDAFFKEKGQKYYTNGIYNAVCVYALNNDVEKGIKWLDYLVNEKWYSNIKHIKNDLDIINLQNDIRWKDLLLKIESNKKDEPKRKREQIKTALLKVKNILIKEASRNVWRSSLWSKKIIVIDYDKTIYSLDKLPNSNTIDSILFFKKFHDNELAFVNSTQKYNGENYATVMINVINDNSTTIIHELFHLSHFKIRDDLNTNPISYLDDYDARVLLRLEYQSLRNVLRLIDENGNRNTILEYINDAFIFRKTRQNEYSSFLKDEVDIETVEGLANYTGILLSTYPNKYRKAINEINERESAKTYTRPFPYATGPAYGLIFDYLGIKWKKGLDDRYNFLNIYETDFLKAKVQTTHPILLKSQQRNNYTKIHAKELKRKEKQDALITYYTQMFVQKPTLSVELINNKFGLLFNMNGTIYLDDVGIVYSGAKGTSMDKSNFGNFEIISGKDKLGEAGVLAIKGEKTTYKFPLPIKIKESKIYGEFYIIELNPNWIVEQANSKGDLKIVRNQS